METVALIFATLALALSCVSLGIHFGIIDVAKQKPDKYEKYRTNDGLLGRKKDG